MVSPTIGKHIAGVSLQTKTGRFGVRNGLFCIAERAVSECKTVRIVARFVPRHATVFTFSEVGRGFGS